MNSFNDRKEKIQRLRNVMGINETHDPDDTYELTTDNVKKMMAVHMRFRSVLNIDFDILTVKSLGTFKIVYFGLC